MKKSILSMSLALMMLFAGFSLAAQAAAPTPDKPLELRFGTIYADNTPAGLTVKKFSELISAKTKGAISAVHYPSEQLGTEQEMIESAGMGAIDMTSPGQPTSGIFQKQCLIFAICYLVDDYDHLRRIMASDFMGAIMEEFRQNTKARVVASNWFRGPRYFYGSRRVDNVEDLTGFRVRVAENPSFVKSWQALGASPTPMALAETYSGIQTGALDGAETTLAYYRSNGYYNVAPYFMLTSQAFDTNLCIMNDELFNSLSPEFQQAILECAYEAGLYNQQAVLEDEQASLEFIEKNGATLVPVDRAKWRAKMVGVADELWEIWGDKELYGKIRSVSTQGK